MRGKRSLALIGAFVLACVGGSSFAARAGANPPATVSFDGSAAYRITGDGQGIYGPGATSDGAVCDFQSTGNIELDLRSSAARWINIDFTCHMIDTHAASAEKQI